MGKRGKSLISLKQAWYSCQRHCSFKDRCSCRRSHPFCLYHCSVAAGKHQSPQAMQSHKITARGRAYWGKAETTYLEQHGGKGLPDLLESWPVSCCPLLSLLESAVSLNSKHWGVALPIRRIKLDLEMLSPCKQILLHPNKYEGLMFDKSRIKWMRERQPPHTLSDHCPEALTLLFPPYPLSCRLLLLLFPQNRYHSVSWHPLAPGVPAKTLLVSQVL